MTATRYRAQRPRAFTLIEVLVVVAIIALLIAILMPSLATARSLARQTVCATNVKSLTTAFLAYSTSFYGRLPAARRPNGADWLGGRNVNKLYPDRPGRVPDDGTIFPYAGRQKHLYTCPAGTPPLKLAPGSWYYSYTHHALISGAKVESLHGAHYPLDDGAGGFTRTDHTIQPMRPFNGVPMVMEEDPVSINYTDDPLYTQHNDSRFIAGDCLSDVHRAKSSMGAANIGFADGHAEAIRDLRPPALDANQRLQQSAWRARHFTASTLCVRTGRKWVYGGSISPEENEYGFINSLAVPAETGSLTYPSNRTHSWPAIRH